MSVGLNTTGSTRSVQATVHQIDELHIYELTKEELTFIVGNSYTKSLFSVLTGISISACVSFLITIWTTPILDPKVYATFVAIVIVFGLFTLICGFFWLKSEIIAFQTGNEYLKREYKN